MKYTFLVTLFNLLKIAVLSFLLSACTQTGVNLLNTLSKTGDYTITTDIAYGTKPENKLDIYRPTQQKKRNNHLTPVVVFFYGGCWGECNNLQKKDYRFVAQSFVSKGYTTVIADFRQYPDVNFPAIMADATQVVRWLSTNIVRYGGDANRTIVMGHSSGAHIAAMLAMNPRYLKSVHKNIKGFIGLAGPYDFMPFDEEYQKILFAPPQRYAESQPVKVISSNAPPILLLHGKKDTTVRLHNAVNLSQKAQSIGVKQRLIVYPQHNHVGILLALSKPLKNRSSVLADALTFIRQQTQQ